MVLKCVQVRVRSELFENLRNMCGIRGSERARHSLIKERRGPKLVVIECSVMC